MKTHFHFLVTLGAALLVLAACESKPKVIQSQSEGGAESPVLEQIAASDAANTAHDVTVGEVLHTERYTYLNVSEGDKTYWIAIPRSEVAVGERLVYRGGLTKKNFQSQEYDRIFETLVLVSDIRRAEPVAEGAGSAPAVAETPAQVPVTPAKGAVRIAEILNNAAKYAGKSVMVTGQVVKVNPMIMSRNWVHLRDDSSKDKDLTFTTTEQIRPGAVITLQGKVAVNKDFGAGYRYDVIVEDCVVVQ